MVLEQEGIGCPYILQVCFSLRLILFLIIVNGYWIPIVALTYALMCKDCGTIGNSTRESRIFRVGNMART